MTDVFVFEERWLAVEEVEIVPALVDVWIDSEVAHPEGSEVLKKMGSLAGIDAVLIQARFNNDPGIGYLWPAYRDTKPGITGTPAAGANQHKVFLFSLEPVVTFFKPECYFLGLGSIPGGRFYINEVMNILYDSISESSIGNQQGVVVCDFFLINMNSLIPSCNRPDLLQAEHFRVVGRGIQVYRKFDLYRLVHLPLPYFKYLLQYFGKGKGIMSQLA